MAAKVTGQLRRLAYVDGLRALAALNVMSAHMEETAWPHPPKGWNTELMGYDGHFAVSVFIVLSGFSLMLPVARNLNRIPDGSLGFYLRRARRILPPYYIALGLALALIWLFIGQATGTPWDLSFPVTGWGLVTHLALLHNFTADAATINPVFWSIAVECQIYVLFPALLLLWRRYHPVFCAALVVTLSLLLTAALALTWMGQLPRYGVASVTPQYIGLFAMGMCAASLTTAPPSSRWRHWRDSRGWDVCAWLGVVVWLVWTWAGNSARYYVLTDVLVGATVACALLACSRRRITRHRSLLRAILEWRPLVGIGGISYSIYLVHSPLLQLIWQYGVHPLGLSATANYLLLLLVGAPLIALAAWGFWYLAERPFMSQHWKRPQDSPANAV